MGWKGPNGGLFGEGTVAADAIFVILSKKMDSVCGKQFMSDIICKTPILAHSLVLCEFT